MPMSINTALLCIGAGPEQVPAIELGRRMGYRVVALDGNPQAPGLRCADNGIVVDPRNIEAVISIAREVNASCIVPVPLGAVLTTVGAVNDAMGWQGISYRSAVACTDKTVMRRALAKEGVIQPNFLLAHSPNDVRAAVQALGLPVVLKPVRGSGSRGVALICSEGDLDLELVKAQYTGQFKVAGGMMVESELPGSEYGVDAVVAGGECTVLSVRVKVICPPPHRVAIEYTGPIPISSTLFVEVQTTIQTAVRALELNDCLVHADILIDVQKSSVSLIEISGRPSGFGLGLEMLPACLGINPVEQMIRMLLGQSFSFKPRMARVGRLKGLFDRPGKLVAVGDLKAARELQGVLSIHLPLAIGDRVPALHSGTDWWSAGVASVVADNLQELDALWLQMRDVLSLHVE